MKKCGCDHFSCRFHNFLKKLRKTKIALELNINNFVTTTNRVILEGTFLVENFMSIKFGSNNFYDRYCIL